MNNVKELSLDCIQNLPFHCHKCSKCNSNIVNLCSDWVMKWLSKPYTSFEFSRRLYNNSWRIFGSCFYV